MALPAVEYLGKRYTILLSLLIFLASNIWAANANSYNSLLGSRFLGGFSGGVIEALGPSIVSECFHEHQLARAMVVYVGFLAAGSAAGPIVAGGIASGLGNWRWFFGVSSIAIGINIITCVLMLPDTIHTTDDYALDDAPADTTPEGEKESTANAEYIESSIERASTRPGANTDSKLASTLLLHTPHLRQGERERAQDLPAALQPPSRAASAHHHTHLRPHPSAGQP